MAPTQLEHKDILVDPGPAFALQPHGVCVSADQDHLRSRSTELHNGIRAAGCTASSGSTALPYWEFEQAGCFPVCRSGGEIVSIAVRDQETHGLPVEALQLALASRPLVGSHRAPVQGRNSCSAGAAGHGEHHGSQQSEERTSSMPHGDPLFSIVPIA